MQIVRRLIREFWLPALVAVGWTGFNIYSTNTWDLKSIVNVFGPSFFLASWATGQFFRVQKQVGLDKNLNNIDARVTALVDRLEQHTTDFLGYATGGESRASFLPMIPAKDTFGLTLHNQSKYPVFDICAEAIDLDEPIDPNNGRFWTRHPFLLQSLFPMKGVDAYQFDLRGRERLRVNVFIHARNGGLTQQFRVARVDDWFAIAFRTKVDGRVVEEVIPQNYPGLDPEDQAKVFS